MLTHIDGFLKNWPYVDTHRWFLKKIGFMLTHIDGFLKKLALC
jgi:hypothetical protein